MSTHNTITSSNIQSPQIPPQQPQVQSLKSPSINRPSSVSTPSQGPVLGTSKVRKLRSKPHILSNQSNPKLIYSVDDNYNELNSDLEEYYLEGFNDALRYKLLKRKEKDRERDREREREKETPSRQSQPRDREGSIVSSFNNVLLSPQVAPSNFNSNMNTLNYDPISNNDEVEQNIINNLSLAEQNIEQLEEINNDSGDESNSIRTSNSIESLNLRERQDAINTTHPFGIKIWKPSLYKKIRSVENKADLDIHEFNSSATVKRVNFGIILMNYLWTVTFGLLMFLVCLTGAMCVGIFSIWDPTAKNYSFLFVRLGRYLLFPFGKIVSLIKDENYLYEDEMYGRSVVEYQRWRSEEEGRLFFAPPKRNSNETRPLLDSITNYSPSNNNNYNSSSAISNNDSSSNIENANDDIKKRFFGRGNWSIGRFVFYLYNYTIFQPIFYTVSLCCWLGVFTIPMAKLTNILCDHIRRHPLALNFKFDSPNLNISTESILLCTYRSCGWHYYKYTVDGTNIFFINLLSAVLFVISDFYILKESLGWSYWYNSDSFIFGACLFSIIPLAYFIGQAVASISAQSSMGVGAVINAFFSTVVEIFLYCVALNQKKGRLVEGSMIGSILGGVLLLPGLSMCGGALKRKTQRYNPRSAGVSSTMLLFASMVMFAPSLFHQIYGSYEIKCLSCEVYSTATASIAITDDCKRCRFVQPSLSLDKLYINVLKPFSLICATALFTAYIVGLWFTLRTHAALIWATNSHDQIIASKKELGESHSFASLNNPNVNQLSPSTQSQQPNVVRLNSITSITSSLNQRKLMNQGHSTSQNPTFNSKVVLPFNQTAASTATNMDQINATIIEESGGGVSGAGNEAGHDAPNWSRTKSTVILLGATLLYAIIAEILVDTVDEVLKEFPINPKFLGLTVFALVPNTTEFLNAISFAVNGNVALSMEIGSAYALQVVLIQIPSLVVYSIYQQFDDMEQMFSLIFPRWDLVASVVSIYLFTYVYAEGKSNYFKGVILILIYVVVLCGFWFNGMVGDIGSYALD